MDEKQPPKKLNLAKVYYFRGETISHLKKNNRTVIETETSIYNCPY